VRKNATDLVIHSFGSLPQMENSLPKDSTVQCMKVLPLLFKTVPIADDQDNKVKSEVIFDSFGDKSYIFFEFNALFNFMKNPSSMLKKGKKETEKKNQNDVIEVVAHLIEHAFLKVKEREDIK
jgi:hypothetical protein